MAAAAFKIYNLAKKRIGNGQINLASGNFRMQIHTSASNAANVALGTIQTRQSVTSEVTEANGYSSSGKPLTGRVWTIGTGATQYKFDFDDVVWTATGGTLPNLKFAVIWQSGASAGAQYLLAYASLTSAQFTVATGNTVTIVINVNGCFTMS